MTKKKVINVILSMCIFMTSLISPNLSASAKSVVHKGKEGTELLLNRLGVNVVYDEEAYMTRGDFTVLAVQAMDYTLIEGKNPFKDVSEEQDKYISTAACAEIISKNDDGLFYPDRLITAEEAVTICLRLLGYGDILKNEAYPSGYVAKAGKLGLLKNLDFSEALTGAEATTLIFNTLNTKYITEKIFDKVEKTTYELSGESYLYDHYGVERGTGVITSFYGVSLGGYAAAKRSEIAVDSVVYENPYYSDFGYYTYLGQKVEYYMQKDEESAKIIYIKPYDEPEAVDYTDVLSVKGFDKTDSREDRKNPCVTYSDEDGNSETIYVKADATILINGEKRLAVSNDDFSGESGRLVFIDSNGDSVADVVAIEQHTYYKVRYFDEQSGKLEVDDHRILFNAYDFDDYKLFILSGDREVSTDFLKDDTVVQVMATYTDTGEIDVTKNAVLTVKAQAITGTIEAINSDREIIIDGAAYKALSNIYDELKNRVGSSGTFRLGNENLIVAYDDFDDIKALEYGYLVSATKDGAFGNDIKLLIYTIDDEMKVFEISDDFKYTGIIGGNYVVGRKVKKEDFLSVVSPEQLIRYQKDTNGKIALIETAYDHTGEQGYDGFDDNRFSLDWQSNSAFLYQRYIDKNYYATNGTTYFYVTAGSINEDDFATGSYILNGYQIEGVKVKVYNSDRYMYPNIVVVENYPANKVRLQDSCGSLLLVTNKHTALNDEGEEVTAFDSFLGRNYNTHKASEADLAPINSSHYNHPTTVTKISELENGDVVTVASDGKGEITRYIVLHEYDETQTASSWYAYANDFDEYPHLAAKNYVCGKIVAYVPNSHIVMDCDENQRFMFSRQGLTYWEYDVKKDKMSNPQSALPRLAVGDYVWFMSNRGNISQLIRYVNN